MAGPAVLHRWPGPLLWPVEGSYQALGASASTPIPYGWLERVLRLYAFHLRPLLSRSPSVGCPLAVAVALALVSFFAGLGVLAVGDRGRAHASLPRGRARRRGSGGVSRLSPPTP